MYLTRKRPSLFARLIILLMISFSFAVWIPSATVTADDVPQGGGLVAPKKEWVEKELAHDDLRERVMTFVNYFLSFLGLAAVVVVIYGGILMVVAAGDEEQVKKGKTAIFYSLIGIVIVLFSYTLVNWVILASDGPSSAGTSRSGTSQPTSAQTVAGLSQDVQGSLQSMQTQVNSLQTAENTPEQIVHTREVVREFFDRLPETQLNQQRLQYLIDRLNQLERDVQSKLGTDDAYTLEDDIDRTVRDLSDELELLDDDIEEFPVMVAKIQAEPYRGSAPLTVLFDGTGSFDPTQQTIPDSNYHWSYRDNTGAVRTLPSKPVVTETFEEVGKYVVQLRVETANIVNGAEAAIDGLGFIHINVETPPTEIKMKINGDDVKDLYKVTLEKAKEGLTFDARESVSKLARSITLLKWDFGDNFQEEKLENTVMEHIYTESKDYRVKVEMIDDQGAKTTKNYTIRVKDLIADMKIFPEQGDTQSVFVFDGGESQVSEGHITDYTWVIKLGNEEILSSDQQRFEYQFDKPGIYEVKLTVQDSLGQEDLFIEEVIVSSQAPVVNYTWKPFNASTPSTLQFDATSTFDPDRDDEIFFSWDFDGDGEFELTDIKDRIVKHTYGSTGEFEAHLLVKDAYGAETKINRPVQIKSLLDVDFNADRFAAPRGSNIQFQASSAGADSFFWDFNDGATDQTDVPTTAHTFERSGTYRVSVTAYDKNDNETTITKTVYIGDKDKPLAIMRILLNGQEYKVQPDICGIGRDGIVITRNDDVFFDASLSLNNNGTNRGLNYAWDFGDAEYDTDKKTTHRYTELTGIDECNEVILVVKDRATGAIHRSKILYIRIINRLPQFTRFMVEQPQKKLITPIDVDLQIVGAHDFDGRISQYRFWYYYDEDYNEKYGLLVTNKPFAKLTILPKGFEGEDHTVHFGMEVIDSDGGRTRNFDLGQESIPLAIKNGPNMPPEVILKSNKTTIKAGDAITFYAEATDPQGGIIPNTSYHWDYEGDGKIDDKSSGSQVSHIYTIPGEYQVRVKVSYKGLSTTEKHTIYVDSLTEFPVSAFLFTIQGLEVDFDASNSLADDSIPNNALSFFWDFNLQEDSDGDGDPANDIDSNEQTPIFKYTVDGNYEVKLTVKDSIEMKNSVIHKVNIGGAGGVGVQKKNTLIIRSIDQPITSLDVSIEKSVIKKNETVAIDIIVLNADGRPYEGEITFLLLEGTGQFIPEVVRATNSRAQTIFKPLETGTIQFKITAKNAKYGTLEEKMRIIVR